jgi:hypothetical protein
MIYTIGDSHSKFGWSKIDNVIVNWLGPKLMFTFNEADFNIANINDQDSTVFCFGEIDCRCHIKKHIINGDYTTLIKNMALDYVSKILKIKQSRKIKNVFIYNILPTRRVDSKEPYMISCETYQEYNRELAEPYPFIGSDEERKEYTIFFNSELQMLAERNGLGFIDIYHHYTDQDGHLNINLSDGTVHIGDEKYLKEYLKNYLKND